MTATNVVFSKISRFEEFLVCLLETALSKMNMSDVSSAQYSGAPVATMLFHTALNRFVENGDFYDGLYFNRPEVR